MKEFRVYDDAYCEEVFEANDWEEALESAEEWARGGEWPDEGCVVPVTVESEGVSKRIDVEIEPNHRKLIRQADPGNECCGHAQDDHEWVCAGEGGCKENPGVWSVSGTGLVVNSHCYWCGLHRTEYFPGSQRNPDERYMTVEYQMPDDREIMRLTAMGAMDIALDKYHLRYDSCDAFFVVWCGDEFIRIASISDLDTLPTGEDLTKDESKIVFDLT